MADAPCKRTQAPGDGWGYDVRLPTGHRSSVPARLTGRRRAMGASTHPIVQGVTRAACTHRWSSHIGEQTYKINHSMRLISLSGYTYCARISLKLVIFIP